MNRDTIARTFPLFGGISVRFSFTADCGLLAEWFPMLPHFRARAERQRFRAGYTRARKDFLAVVEAETGAPLGELETCGEPKWVSCSQTSRVRVRRKSVRAEASP
jgi:hypothetical protein